MSTKKLQIIGSLVGQAQDADTVDGKHASDFAAASDVESLKTLVGDTSVSNQISDAIANKSDVGHTHENVTLYDTVSGVESITIEHASITEHELTVTLSSATYTDFSNIAVVLTSDNGEQTVAANADGSVTGLHSEPSFTLALQCETDGFDASQVEVACIYQIDLSKVLQDYVLHVDLGDGNDSGDGSIGTGSVIIDSTLSVEGAAADAKAVGAAINNIDSQKVPVTRTINGKALDTDIILTADDLGVISEVETDTTLEVSGMPADAKVTGDAITNLNTLVGNTPVADQIADAIVEVYVQDEEPTDALTGSIWVDTDEEGLSGTPEKNTANVYVVDAATTDITTVDFSKYAVGDVVLVTTS